MRNYSDPLRTCGRIFVCLCLVAALSAGVLVGCNGTEEEETNSTPGESVEQDTDTEERAEAAMQEIFIKSVGTRCGVTDASDSHRIHVIPGQYVVFRNQVGRNIKLHFSPNKKLFGVVQAISYADGDATVLKVLDDAEQGEHDHMSNDCGTTEPPPIIIVDPPGP